MSKKIIKPVSAAIGTVLLTTLSATTYAAEGNPFEMKTLSSGYMQLASADDAKKGEQDSQPSTDQKKADHEGKCGEGKCGAKGDMKKNMEGQCGGKKAEQEGKCGEGKCGSSNKK